ncbi:MAG TPA: adenylate/guanylate cyclase domain-containing protein [Gemmatimonadales bacterium]|nr:adenylate/guanylate cyclase domain-containing protein [Gemmatimonadales bacterium]
MGRLQSKSLLHPDEREAYPLGYSDEVHLGEIVVALTHQEPGWRWSEHIRPIVGTKSCLFHHTGVVLKGRLIVQMDDGTRAEFGPFDVFDLPPGHDAWVVGDEVLQTIDWIGAHRWASPPSGVRILATLLFTDIVDSTALAERHGDVAWSVALEEHLAISRRVLDRYRGREVVTTGDGMLATFDGAERAVLAALALSPALAELGIEVRTGVHTGEIEVVPDNVRGVAVHVAARVMALAGPGEVIVSDVTRVLIENGGIRFEDRGEVALKGISGTQRVYRAWTKDSES